MLEFLACYYEEKRRLGGEFYCSAEIFGALASSKNKFSAGNLDKIRQIKQNILFKGFEQVGQNIEHFCDQVFRQHVKKRKEPRMEIERTQQIVIEPSLTESFVSFTN